MLTIIYVVLRGLPIRDYVEANRHLISQGTPTQIFALLFVGFAALFLILSMGYTVGGVVGSLAMVESAVTVEKPRQAYIDSEVEPLIHADFNLDVRTPITASLGSSMRLLQRRGASYGQGFGYYALYCTLHFLFTLFWSHLYSADVLGVAAISTVMTVALARQHMRCTHRMMGYAADAESVAHRDTRTELAYVYRILFLPSLVQAVVQHATVLLALALVSTFRRLHAEGFFTLAPVKFHFDSDSHGHLPALALLLLSAQILFVLSFLFILSLILLLHTSIVLTRIEAALLPAEMIPLLPLNFGRVALAGSGGNQIDLDLDQHSLTFAEVEVSWTHSAALFRSTWRSSLTKETFLRVGKIYVKLLALQSMVLLVGLGLIRVWL